MREKREVLGIDHALRQLMLAIEKTTLLSGREKEEYLRPIRRAYPWAEGWGVGIIAAPVALFFMSGWGHAWISERWFSFLFYMLLSVGAGFALAGLVSIWIHHSFITPVIDKMANRFKVEHHGAAECLTIRELTAALTDPAASHILS